jgi:8-oxo-dGTP pyrophosphatase MutT (NUDIX family)
VLASTACRSPTRCAREHNHVRTMPAVPAADPAATIIALRQGPDGIEVLMVRRNSRGFFGDLVVFPGGAVEDIDVPEGLTRHEDLPHRNAALREFAEETGILITIDGPIRAPRLRDGDYYHWLDDQELSPWIDGLVLVSRWVTPEAAPRRFDTRFYVVGCVDAPGVVIDPDELIWHEWVNPQVALERHQRGEWPMFRPTTSHLRWLRRWDSIDDATKSAEGADGRTLILPRVIDDGSLLPIHMPAELP